MVSAQQDGVVRGRDRRHLARAARAAGRAYVAGVLWALRRDGLEVGGLDVVVDSTVPFGAGLSSSAALECAVAAAASDLYGLGLLDSAEGRARLAALCVEAENVIAGAPTGGMDQSAVAALRRGRSPAARLPVRRHRAGALRPRRQPGTRCSSPTPGPSTHSSTGSMPPGATRASRPPEPSGSRPCARSRLPTLDAALDRLGLRGAAAARASRRHRDRARHPRGRGAAGRRPRRGRAALRRLARLAARRLRGVVRRARRRDRHRARPRRARAPG